MAKLSTWFSARDEKNSDPCPKCKGAGCHSCNGFGWDFKSDACMVAATGRICDDCPNRSACRKG